MPPAAVLVSVLLVSVLAVSVLPAAGDEPPAYFADVSAEVGLDFVHWNGMSGELYFPEIMGSGGALFDADGDGDLDLYLVQGAWLGDGDPKRADPPAPEARPRDRLYRNDLEVLPDGRRRLRLVDVTAASGLDAPGYGIGVATGDYDADGDLDLYITNLGPNQLWRNEGPGADGVPRFRDVTAETGTAAGEAAWSTSASFADLDGDGRLDLFVASYVRWSTADRVTCYAPSSRRDYCGPDAYPPAADVLLRNLGPDESGTVRFEDVSLVSGIARAPQPGLGVVAADLDGDRRPEVFVANDGRPNQLWKAAGDGSFEDVGLFSGVAVNRMGQPEASMGIVAEDLDEDGDDDLFLTHLTEETNTLLINDGSGLFEDRTLESGLGADSLALTAFGTVGLDVDNDGRLDLPVMNGAVHLLEPLLRRGVAYPLGQRNQLFMSRGGGRFEEVGERAGESFGRLEVSRGLAVGDVDDDGDGDLLVLNNSGPARLLRNEVGHLRPWLGLRLLGDTGGDALGARVEVRRRGAPPLHRRVHTDGSFASASDPRVLVGLGGGSEVTGVVVVWPDGREERFDPPPLGRYTTLRRSEGRAGEAPEKTP